MRIKAGIYIYGKYENKLYFPCLQPEIVDIMGMNRRKMPILRMKVKKAPSERPVMFYDGECSFCRRSAFYLRGITHRQVDFAAWQYSYTHFPEIDKTYFAKEVKLITPAGYVFSGAEAILKALQYGSPWGFLFSLYSVCPPFRWLSEAIYRMIARKKDEYSKKVGPFWIDWDSGGAAYETHNPRRKVVSVRDQAAKAATKV